MERNVLKLLERLTDTGEKCIYIFDLLRDEFCFACSRHYFLRELNGVTASGHRRGMERLRAIVHPKDFDRYVYYCSVIYQTVLERPWDSISHFSMNVHINVRSTYLRTHIRVVPYIREGSPETLLFVLSPSADRDPEVLLMHEKQGRTYRRYDTKAEGWGRSEKSLLLTRREREVMMHAKNGLTYKEIALLLRCSERTVRNLTTRLYRKLDASSMIESIRMVDNYNLLRE